MTFKRLLKNLLLVVLSVFILSCSSKTLQVENTRESSSQKNTKNIVYPLKQPLKKVLGSWQGFMYCGKINYLFDLNISKSTNDSITAVFESKLYFYNSGDRASGAYPSELKLNLSGRFFPEKSMFLLRAHSRDKKKQMTLRGVLDTASPRFVADVVLPHFGWCSMALAGKDDIADLLESIHEASEFKTNLFYHPRDSNRCDGAMKKWVKKVAPITVFDFDYRDPKVSGKFKYAALEILQDKYFKPYFNESFTDLSESEMGGFYRKLVNGCSYEHFRKESSLKILENVFILVQNQQALPRSELVMYPHIKRVLSNWKKSAIQELASFSPSKSQQLSVVADSILAPLWPSESGNIKGELQVSLNSKADKKMLSDLNAEISKKPLSFSSLAKLAGFVETYAGTQNNQAKGGKINPTLSAESIKKANKIVKDTLDLNVLNAAKKLVLTVYTTKGMQDFLMPIGIQPYYALYKILDIEKIKQINKIFDDKKLSLLSISVNQESKNYSSIESNRKGLILLRNLNNYEVRLRKTYKDLLKSKAFSIFNIKRTQRRTQVLSENKVIIKKEIESARTLKQLTKTYDSLLLNLDKETKPGLIITVYYNQQRHIISPFLEYPGGEYLDAIYRGDFSSLRTQDRNHGKMIAENFEQAMQGLAPGSKSPFSLRGIENKMTFIRPISAIYLFSYQSVSGRCLKSDHVEFTVVKDVPGTVTTNLLGWEVGRTYGYSTSSKYLVNKEFEKLFRIVGNGTPNSFSAGFVYNTLGGGLTQEVIKGLRAVTNEFDCSGDVIKQFEENMRTYALSRLK